MKIRSWMKTALKAIPDDTWSIRITHLMLPSFGIRFFIQSALSPFLGKYFSLGNTTMKTKRFYRCIIAWQFPLATDCRLYVTSICCRFQIDTPHTSEMGRNQRSNTLTILQPHIFAANYDILMPFKQQQQKTSIHWRHTSITGSSECHRTLSIIKQNWLSSRLGRGRQKAIGWDNVEPALRRHDMARPLWVKHYISHLFKVYHPSPFEWLCI